MLLHAHACSSGWLQGSLLKMAVLTESGLTAIPWPGYSMTDNTTWTLELCEHRHVRRQCAHQDSTRLSSTFACTLLVIFGGSFKILEWGSDDAAFAQACNATSQTAEINRLSGCSPFPFAHACNCVQSGLAGPHGRVSLGYQSRPCTRKSCSTPACSA